jgi:hypothetical protein
MTSLKCDNLVDALRRITATAAAPHLVSPTPRADLFGQAVRFSYSRVAPRPTHCTLANLFYEAVGDESAAKVIVLASNGLHRHLDGSAIGWLPRSIAPQYAEKRS